MEKTKYLLDKEFLEQEELEAKEKGLTIFQLRRVKKTMEERNRRLELYRKKMHEQLLKKQEKEKKRKEKLKEQNRKKKELKKEKLRLKKEKNRETFLKNRKTDEEIKEKPIKKRPVGRPKKRGPKKKYKRKPKNYIPPVKKTVSWPYKIVACRNGKQIKYIGKYVDAESAYSKINELLDNNKKIIFPSKITHADKIKDDKFEYLILERKTSDNVVLLRNDIGKLVEQKTNSENWVIYDKFKYDVEETFWVWGYNNKSERKTFKWIYDNILIGNLMSEYDIIRVLLYKNKIIFKDDDENLDMVFCKSISDAIRFYNLLQEWIKKDKIKQIFFLGQYNDISEKRRQLENQIMKLTGWSKKKIQMSSTSEHIK